MLLNALMGKGLQVDRSGSTNAIPVYIPESEGGRMINPYTLMPPPFIGTWNNPVGTVCCPVSGHFSLRLQ